MVEPPDFHRFHHRRPGRELKPFHDDSLRRKMLLECGLLSRDHQHAVLLIADADFLEAGFAAPPPAPRRRLPRFQEKISRIPDASLRSPDENAATARDHSISAGWFCSQSKSSALQ